jgi:general L-amino acid transport system permease protein
VWHWCQHHLWRTPVNALLSVLLLACLMYALPEVFEWAVWHAVFRADAEACQAMRSTGACWGVITEKHRLILWGRYPFDAQWRPMLATGILVLALVVSCVPACWHRGLAWLWAGVWLLFFGLMGAVPSDQWGGLPLTLMLATLSISLAFPLAILVALGRQSQMPAIRSVCIVYIEVVRGVPLISVLFMASFMIPLLLPTGTSPDVLLRVLMGITLFSAAYLAEIVRGGLQALPRGQLEAAASLGLGYWHTQRLVVLPQALTHVIPGIVNNFIAVFKDTSLVTIVSLYELSGSLGLAIQGDPNWRPFQVEGYVFIALIYFVFCFGLSRYSLWVERRVSRR